MLNTPENYDLTWDELNTLLSEAETRSGLSEAIRQLEANQQQTGFIKDSLLGVQRHVYSHPEKPECQFRIQFNAKRAERFNGAGVATPPQNMEAVNGGCFLCRENVLWQQQGRELGYALSVNDQAYHAWMNPFPLMPGHVVIASSRHETQEWEFADNGGQDVKRLIADLVELACRMPNGLGFYNGVNAGASIPGHLHFQFFQRPEGYELFPLERRMADKGSADDQPTIDMDYPLPVAKWQGPADAIANAAASWIKTWAAKNCARMGRLSANIIVSAQGRDDATLYFVPRERTLARGAGMSGLIGGLEVLGELVFSSEEEERIIESGEIDYFTINDILASVRTVMFVDEPS